MGNKESTRDFLKKEFGSSIKTFLHVFYWLILGTAVIILVFRVSGFEANSEESTITSCSVVAEYTNGGQLVEDHLEVENDSYKIVYDEGTPVSICITVGTGTDEGPKRFYLKLTTDTD